MIIKKSLTMALAVVVTSAMFFVTGCSKSDNPVSSGGGGLADQNLVGVWWTTSGSGMSSQILADGTTLQLTAYGGKIAVDTAAAKLFTVKITASNGTGTYAVTSKTSTGKDTTTSNPFTYVLSNSNNNLSVTQNGDAGTPVTTTYTRKNIGDAAAGGGTTSNTLSITFDGTSYTMTASVSAKHDTLTIYGFTLASQECVITVMNQLGSQTVVTSLAAVTFLPNSSTYYISSAGTITVTIVSGTNTQGTFSVTMINPSSPTATKTATGSFNVTQ
jgi:hypothetical protein